MKNLAFATCAESFPALNDNAPAGLTASFLKPRALFQTYATQGSFLRNNHAVPASGETAHDLHEAVHAWGRQVRADYCKLLKRQRAQVRAAAAATKQALSLFSIAYVASALALAFVLQLVLERAVN